MHRVEHYDKHFQKLPVELVVWVDSNGLGHWHGDQEAEEFTRSKLFCRTIGLVLAEYPDRISFAQTDGMRAKNNMITIPKCSIVARKRLGWAGEIEYRCKHK